MSEFEPASASDPGSEHEPASAVFLAPSDLAASDLAASDDAESPLVIEEAPLSDAVTSRIPLNQENQLPTEALTIDRLGNLFTVGVITALFLAADIGVRFIPDVDLPWPPVVIPLLLGVFWAALGWWWAGKVYNGWMYELRADRLRVLQGVVFRNEAIIPRSRVQHVSTNQGPLQRRFELISVVVHTAGARTPNVSIPDLPVQVAEDLRADLIGSDDH